MTLRNCRRTKTSARARRPTGHVGTVDGLPREDSNLRPLPYQRSALTTELHGNWWEREDSNLRSLYRQLIYSQPRLSTPALAHWAGRSRMGRQPAEIIRSRGGYRWKVRSSRISLWYCGTSGTPVAYLWAAAYRPRGSFLR